MNELFANSTLYVYVVESHFMMDSVPLKYMNVLKSRNMKYCLNQPEMSYLPNMTHESRLCLEKVVNTSTHMI